MGEKLGVSRQAVSKWETGESYPDVLRLKEMAKLFSLSVDELLDEDDQNEDGEDEKEPNEKRGTFEASHPMVYGYIIGDRSHSLYPPLSPNWFKYMIIQDGDLYTIVTILSGLVFTGFGFLIRSMGEICVQLLHA